MYKQRITKKRFKIFKMRQQGFEYGKTAKWAVFKGKKVTEPDLLESNTVLNKRKARDLPGGTRTYST
jgi:hypothetical protein